MSTDISILLIEDDEKECDVFKEYCLLKEGIKLVAITNSSDRGLEFVKTHSPEGVILDIELNYGIGSGYKFLKELNMLKIDNKPVIVVTTNIDSEIAYDNIHSYGVPTILFKNKQDYSPELVIDTVMELVNTARRMRKIKNESIENVDTEEMKRKRIENKILQELEAIGISDNLKGKRYLFEAIYYLIENGVQDIESSAIRVLENKHKKTHSNIIRVMQTAIYHAWRISTIETLEKQYTAVVYHNTGVPTVNEFIYYYANKIYKYFE